MSYIARIISTERVSSSGDSPSLVFTIKTGRKKVPKKIIAAISYIF